VVKFLIIRLSSIGDIVLTTPVVRCLKKQVKGSEVHFLMKKQYACIFENNPYIDRLWLYDKNLPQIIHELKRERFDYIIDLHRNLRTLWIKSELKVLSFSFDKLNIRKWILVNFKMNTLPQIHIVDRYLATTKLFDVKNDGEGLDYFLSSEDKKPLPEIEALKSSKYIALSIGAKHNTKKAPAAKLVAIIDRLQLPVVILGDGTDHIEAEKICQMSSNKNILDLTGKLSLNKSANVIMFSKIVITHDTGLMHIAAAFRKIIISIWGSTIPEFGMYPNKPGAGSRIFEVKGLKCRPCSKLGYKKCPKGHFDCMIKQDESEIAQWVNQLQ